MKNRRFTPDSSVGTLDLVFLLLTLFFLMTVISVRPLSLVDDVSADEGNNEKAPVLLEITSLPELEHLEPLLSLSSSGKLQPPNSDTDLLDWLSENCRQNSTIVHVKCPDNATHLECKRGLAAIRKKAPDCRYQY